MKPASIDVKDFLVSKEPAIFAGWAESFGTYGGTLDAVCFFDKGAWKNLLPGAKNYEHPIVKVVVVRLSTASYETAYTLAEKMRNYLADMRSYTTAASVYEGAFIEGDIVGMDATENEKISFEVRLLRRPV